MTNYAVLITALIEAGRKNLSLYNAILVSYLCTLHIFPSYAVLLLKGPPKSASARKVLGMNTALAIVVMCSDIFGLYIWIKAKNFGSQPECNSDTLLILFGKAYSATTPHARIVAIGEPRYDGCFSIISESLFDLRQFCCQYCLRWLEGLS